MSAFGASNDVNELISLVRNWKMELEKIPSLDAVKRDAIAENLNECQKMSSNLLVQFMVEDMHGQLKCTENAATVSEVG
jgi:hypothetical protein